MVKCTLSKFRDNTKLSGAVNTLEVWEAIQRHQDKLEKWAHVWPKKCGQQVERGDSAPLLCSGETPPGVLHPALEPSAQEGQGPVGLGPEEGHKIDQRAGVPLL